MRRLCCASFAIAFAAAGAARAQPPARHFLDDAIRGDNSEMTLGQLAADRGASPGVREYGRTLHDDHAHAKDEAQRVAQNLGVPVPDGMMPEARQEQRKLEHLRGRAFDREFARYMVNDHRKDIAEFQKEAHGSGPVADLARRTLPDLRKHLDMAQQLRRA